MGTLAATAAHVSSHASFKPWTPFVLASADQTLVARGAVRTLRVDASTLSPEVGKFLEERAEYGDAPVLVGALPFDWRQGPHLFEPKAVVLTRGRTARPVGRPKRHDAHTAYRIAARPTRREYEQAVARALETMAAGDADGHRLQKVVLARTLVVESPVPIDIDAIIARLREDRSVTAFSVPLPDRGHSRVAMVGATPELLVKRQGVAVTSTPLAGSARRSAVARLDREAADALLASAKDLREHALVVEWIADRLSPYCKSLRVPPKPTLVSTRSLWHLATRIHGTLRREGISSVELAAALHPTPAVCGVPTDLARATIQELEPFERGYFGGAVGWCAANGDGEWLVAIRCARVSGQTAQLFAGAGIVPGSIPQTEAEETYVKFSALLDALAFDMRSVLLREEER